MEAHTQAHTQAHTGTHRHNEYLAQGPRDSNTYMRSLANAHLHTTPHPAPLPAERSAAADALAPAPFLVSSPSPRMQIEEMITAADLDKDGFINEEEFLRVLKKGSS
jgi:hypothetical protein